MLDIYRNATRMNMQQMLQEGATNVASIEHFIQHEILNRIK